MERRPCGPRCGRPSVPWASGAGSWFGPRGPSPSCGSWSRRPPRRTPACTPRPSAARFEPPSADRGGPSVGHGPKSPTFGRCGSGRAWGYHGPLMCGIVGYVGPDEALPILLEGLRRLEYRGYDSAGVAVLDGSLRVVKRAGKLSELEGALATTGEVTGRVGMGHTRWATHGGPTDLNAHPHVDCSGRIAVIHNGIIENHAALRDRLVKDGHTLVSETDTECVAHLLEDAYD